LTFGAQQVAQRDQRHDLVAQHEGFARPHRT
jgi:hypothetical protein